MKWNGSLTASLLLVVTSGLILPGLAIAQQNKWVPIGETESAAGKTYKLYIDSNSIRPQGKYKKAWFLYDMSADPPLDEGKPYSQQLDLLYFNCSEGTWAKKQVGTYHEGRVVFTTNIPDDRLAFAEPIPGTIGVAMLSAGCGKR